MMPVMFKLSLDISEFSIKFIFLRLFGIAEAAV